MKGNHIIPTVFSYNKKEFEKRFNIVTEVSDKIQIDFMDGKFVSRKSVQMGNIPNLKKYRKKFEAHLMVENPTKWFFECEKKNFNKVIFHIETCKNEKEIIETINSAKKLKLEVYAAINPSTKLRRIFKIVKEHLCEGILILGVIPGKEGQKLFRKIPRRIKKIKKMNSKIIVQVDGGVNDKNIGKLSKAGADYVNSGSFVSKSKNPNKQIKLLEKKFILGKIKL